MKRLVYLNSDISTKYLVKRKIFPERIFLNRLLDFYLVNAGVNLCGRGCSTPNNLNRHVNIPGIRQGDLVLSNYSKKRKVDYI